MMCISYKIGGGGSGRDYVILLSEGGLGLDYGGGGGRGVKNAKNLIT